MQILKISKGLKLCCGPNFIELWLDYSLLNSATLGKIAEVTLTYLGRQRTQHDLLRVKNVAQTHECKFKRIFAQHETN